LTGATGSGAAAEEKQSIGLSVAGLDGGLITLQKT
jgi:hypothetical protein